MPPEKRVQFDNRPERKKKAKISSSHDLIGNHIIALRTFYRSLVDHKKKLQLKKSPGPVPKMPEYPSNYPTQSYLNELRKKKQGTVRQLNFKSHLSKEKVAEMRIFAIKKILSQIGYYTENMKNDDHSLTCLSDILDTFLQSFMIRLRYHKDSAAFSQSQDLWDPLETTLQEWGFHGASGIAKYFYDTFIRMSEALHSDCVKELELINTKYPIQNELPSTSTVLPDSLMSPDLTSTSTSLPSSSMNPDLPSMSTSIALPSSSMNSDLPSTSTALPSSSMNPDLLSTTISIALPNTSMNPDLPSTSAALSSSLMNLDL